MAQIALFHSVLGVRPGIVDAADRLRAAGHDVLVVDQYEGRTFDDYDEAGPYAESIGFPVLMQRAVDGVAGLADGFVTLGFSNGGGMAEYVATQRKVAGAVMISGVLPVAMLGAAGWPAGVPAQVHYGGEDALRRQDWVDTFLAEAATAGAEVECFDYPGAGHLFTDASRAGEYHPDAAAQLWSRVLAFCASVG